MGDVALAVMTLGACVFAASAGGKLRSRRAYQAFLAGLRETGLLGARALPATAAVLAGGEAAIAASLAALAVATAVTGGPGVTPYAQAALAVAAALAGALAAGVAVAVRRGTRAPCACFGARPGRPLGRAHVARNSVLLALLVAGLVTGSFARGHLVPAAAALAVGTGSLAALVIVRWEDLADLFSPVAVAATGPIPAGTAPRRTTAAPRPASTTPPPASTTPPPATSARRRASTTPRTIAAASPHSVTGHAATGTGHRASRSPA